MSTNISVLSQKNLRGPGPSRAVAGSARPVRQGPINSVIAAGQGLQPAGVVPNGTLPAPAPGVNPPSPDPSSFLVPGTVSQTPFAAPLTTQQNGTGLLSHTTTIFGVTAPTVVWVGAGLAVAYVLYTFLKEEGKRR